MNAQNQQATATAQAHESIDLESMADEAQRAWQVAAAAGRDSRALSADHRVAALAALCRALRLNPLTNPIIYVTLNGKEVLYVTRQATDQIAARLGLRRETIEGPEVRDFAGTKLLYCKVRVTFPGPDGRSETSTATLPPTDLVNSIMKVETKAKRRGTLSIAGLGMLGEDDVEGMGVDAALDRTPPSSEPTASLNALALDLDDCTYNRDAVDLWMKHRAALTADGDGVREEGWGLLTKHVMRMMEVKKTAAEKFIRSEIAARDEEARAQRDAAPPKVEPATETTATTEATSAPLDPPTLADFRAQLERCLSLNAVADLWRASRGELVEADRAPAWTASLDRVAVLTSAPSTQGIGALLKKRIAELDAPKPTPPDGGPSGSRTPAAPASADATAAPLPTGAANDAAQASAGPRRVYDADETEARYLRDDSVGAEAWAAHLAACAAIFAMAGAHDKRAEAFRAAGVLATRRAQTLDAIEAREGRGPEAAAQALDGYRTRRVVPIGQSVRARTAAEIRAAQRTGTDG